jgi:hypothetical protein|tara:strand:+ start:223 stop:435 length:213 start_codon:yes stop_codon:yes gene_type:complete
MMNIQQEKQEIIKQRIRMEKKLDEIAYIDDCGSVVDLDIACQSLNQLENYMFMALERINRQQMLLESKRR